MALQLELGEAEVGVLRRSVQALRTHFAGGEEEDSKLNRPKGNLPVQSNADTSSDSLTAILTG